MHEKIFLCIIVILLSGCGISQCLNVADINSEKVYVNVPAQPKHFDEKRAETYWVKTLFEISNGRDQVVSIEPSANFTLCKSTPVNVEIRAGNTVTYNLGAALPTDNILISLKPAHVGYIRQSACDGTDPDVFIETPNLCKQYLHTEYYQEIGRGTDASDNKIFFTQSALDHWQSSGKIKSYIEALKDHPCQQAGTCVGQRVPDTLGSLHYKLGANDQCAPNADFSNYQGNDFSIVTNADIVDLNHTCNTLCDSASGKNPQNDQKCAWSAFEYFDSQQQQLQNPFEMGKSVRKVLPRVTMKINGQVAEYESNSRVIGTRIGHSFSLAPYVPANGGAVALEFQADGIAGGFTVTIEKECNAAIANSLYYTVSKTPPTRVRPGDADTKVVDLFGKFTIPNAPTGVVYFGIKDNGDGVGNNAGSITVKGVIPRKPLSTFSYFAGILSKAIVAPIFGEAFISGKGDISIGGQGGAVEKVFRGTAIKISQLVQSVVLLYVTLRALFYVIGTVRLSRVEVVMTLVKIGIILRLISPDSWTFFSGLIFPFVTSLPVALINNITAAYDDSLGNTNPAQHLVNFEFMDKIIDRFTKIDTWVQIVALIFSGPQGWLCVVLIVWGTYMLIVGCIKVLIGYMISVVLVGLLLSLAPIFIPLILFGRTKGFFDAWMSNLIQIAMQPVLMIGGMLLMTDVAMSTAHAMLNFDACGGCVLKLELKTKKSATESLPDFCLFSFFVPVGYSPVDMGTSQYKRDLDYATPDSGSGGLIGVPITLAAMIAFVLVASMIEKMPMITSAMATSIFGAIGADLGSLGREAVSSALALVGRDDESKQRRAYQYDQATTEAKSGKMPNKPKEAREGTNDDKQSIKRPTAQNKK